MKLSKELEGAATVAISGHVRPDGDCVGACLGLYHYIRKCFPDIQVEVYLEEPSAKFGYLEGFADIRHEITEPVEYDVFFALDCGDRERLGFAASCFEKARRTVCIDHHISNTGDFADSNLIEADAAATCETLYFLMEEGGIDMAAATALYTGLIHDTGVLKHSNTTERTLMAAAKLVGMGVEFTKIINDSFYAKSYVQNQILGRALLESVVFFDGKCIFSALKQKDMVFYGVTPKDLDGIVEQLIVTEGVCCAIFLYETEAQKYKVSMRSKDGVDVSKVAAHFNGGGHVKAAGCTMMGSMHDVLNNLSAELAKQME